MNTIEPSAVPAKRQQRVRSDSYCVHMQQHLSLLSAADALECQIKFSLIKSPCDAAFRQNSLNTCFVVIITIIIITRIDAIG